MRPILSEAKSQLKGGREEGGRGLFFRTGLRVDVQEGWGAVNWRRRVILVAEMFDSVKNPSCRKGRVPLS